jgi:hypothetical protein
MVRGTVVPQPSVPLVGLVTVPIIGPVVGGALGKDVPEHMMQPPRVAGRCLFHDDVPSDRMVAQNSPVPITSGYSIPVPG